MIMFLLWCFGSSFIPTDPLFGRQYHLKNDGSMFHGIAGEDINVIPAWERNLTGKGSKVIIMWDGCDPKHLDLAGRVDLSLSWNFETNSNDPTPNLTSLHRDTGHQMAGIVGGASNDVCGVGVAPEVTIGCINAYEGMSMKYFNEAFMLYPESDFMVVPPIDVCGSASGLAYCQALAHQDGLDSYLLSRKSIYVTSQKGARQTNDDLSLRVTSDSPYVFTFNELTQRGSATMTSVGGHTMLGSVVVGGSAFSSTIGATVTQMVSCSAVNNDTCSQTVYPAMKGGAIAAGVLALMQEASNDKLTRDDYMAIIAMSSVKNDPFSDTWEKNAAGVWYSPLYGFGRLDADAATLMAASWPELKPTTETRVLEVNEIIPTLLAPPSDFTFTVDKKMECVQYISIIVNITSGYDWGATRVWVTSPSGTKRLIKDVQPLSEGYTTVYRVAARDFFGENGEGKWTITLRREGIGMSTFKVGTITVSVTGYEDALVIPEKKSGSDPFTPYPTYANATLELSATAVSCGSTVTAKVVDEAALTGTWIITLRDADDEHSRAEMVTEVYPNMETTIHIACARKTKKYRVIAENMVHGVGVEAEATLEIVNEHTETITVPSPYQVFVVPKSRGYASIPLVVMRNSTSLSEMLLTQTAIAWVKDLDSDSILQAGAVSINHTLYVAGKCKRCLLAVTPVHMDEPSICDTMIQPIMIIGEGEETPEPFILDWNDVCPVPEGVLIDQPTASVTAPITEPITAPITASITATTENPDAGQKEETDPLTVAIIVGVPILVIAVVILVILIVRRRRKEEYSLMRISESLISNESKI